MATSGLPPTSLRTAAPGNSFNMSSLHQKPAMRPIGTPFFSPPTAVTVRMRRLPLGTTDENLRLMVLWAKDLISAEVLSPPLSDDEGYLSGELRFKSMDSAVQAQNMFDGKTNSAGDANMIVTVLGSSPSTVPSDPSPTNTGAALATASVSTMPGPAHTASQSSSGFSSAFGSLDRMSTHPHSIDTPNGYSQFRGVFSPTSPIGTKPQDVNGVSGKNFIENNSNDDETSDLINNPMAFAERGGGPTGRRMTAPQFPVSQMANMSINTNVGNTAPSVTSPYNHPMSAHPYGHHYPMNNHSHRPNLPPVNPADQNPPCNTLYVGNLPLDTHEEELKQLFSKCRGYKRLCFRTKTNGPMCFVEFDDTTFATKVLHDLYGHLLSNSNKGGIRLSFSKNPLGVRGPNHHAAGHAHHGGMNNNMNGSAHAFASANGPPPGLSAPPGLGPTRMNHNAAAANGGYGPNYGWNSPMQNGYSNGHSPGTHTPNGHYRTNGSGPLPPHMMGM
ncbi:uncharacterized protein F5Z01DRAFT_670344 [Emericellopsis atlantica]|uniref:RRM domain-containing protein n=1 Tax=Emericellopsis atlantica TaxID=2614577 RepID=A0A9P8CWM9_9HYPO|nr:uncharacterized protein F5Z01DRAFT_670344 [Emericellopsis atlantica]KAG9258631.1 hypothetical protein F5Z01DRAFT_670344 [Emericellopsis atlantica]